MSTTQDPNQQAKKDIRNKKRREQYAKDPTYQKEVRASNRTQYRARVGVAPRSCAGNIATLASFGQVREVILGRKKEQRLTLTVQEFATAIEYHRWVLYRWHSRGQFPKPTILLEGHKKGASGSYVYTLPQATRLITTLAAHQAAKMHFQQTDTATIEQLNADMKGEI